MKLRQIIPTDMTASAIAHLSLLALVFLLSEVHPFGSVTAEPIAVDIVTPKEIAEKKPEPAPTPTPQLDFSALDKPAATGPPPPASHPSAPAQLQKQAALAAPRPVQQQQTAAQPQPQAASPAPAY